MESDPVQQAKHHEAIAEWGEKNNLTFSSGITEIGVDLGSDLYCVCKIDLTATRQDKWLIDAICQAFRHGYVAGKNRKAAEIRTALAIPNMEE